MLAASYSDKCREHRHVVADIDETNYAVSFEVCENATLSCGCSTSDQSLTITRAYLISDESEHDLQHDFKTFYVSYI